MIHYVLSIFKEEIVIAKARLLDRPEDFKRFGINPDKVEIWEDSRRDTDQPNHFEWWYFDGILDDDTAVVVQFLNKTGRTIGDKKGHPTVFMKVTLPDWTCLNEKKNISFRQSFL